MKLSFLSPKGLLYRYRGKTAVQSIQPGDPGLPRHVAIIMDGNGRWARMRNLPRSAGHEAGLQTARAITQECVRLGIKCLSLYAFSTENWKRPKQEVSFLMNLFYQGLQQVATELHSEDVRIRFIGDTDQLPPKLTALIKRVEAETAQNQKLTLNLAINYGGRAEIIAAVRKLVKKAREEGLAPETITEEQFSRFLFTTGQPDPDLLIRTSGEQRISNFMLWQTAYTEFYFTPTLWPDFSPAEFRTALAAYKKRSRRFGGIKEGRTE